MTRENLDSVQEAARNAGLNLEMVYVVPAHDQPLQQELLSECACRGIPLTLLQSKEPHRDPLHREWHMKRYELMGALRGMVMAEVRRRWPDWFLSFDSDLILHPDSIRNALDWMGERDVVGFKTYMSPPPDRSFPSYGMLKGDSLWNRRDMEDGCPLVDVVMAAILMGPSAYSVPCGPHPAGEDIFWSKAARVQGLRLGWNTHSLAKHVMDPKYLSETDPRVGF